ncbi:hypothetical protein TEA_022140 [Camellia sinensis var. sinensis]|uniref:HPP transmembrane region domain-containing protein n=1 Tax=Camellia sinensis var. sinensis TaxID=542762 RepID=A0A4S4DR55_CAMSN|nr:hypothetical protein TEA_022140 [Camellia sinensis var. sinensis]
MGIQLRTCYYHHNRLMVPSLSSLLYASSSTISISISLLSSSSQIADDKSRSTINKTFRLYSGLGSSSVNGRAKGNWRRKRVGSRIVAASSNNADAPISWDDWKPQKGAFASMAVLGKMDQMLARKGVSMTIAPFGAVCAVLFATPSSPAARVTLPPSPASYSDNGSNNRATLYFLRVSDRCELCVKECNNVGSVMSPSSKGDSSIVENHIDVAEDEG